MEEFDPPFFVTHGDYEYQVIPSDGSDSLDSSFLVLVDGVKAGDLTMDDDEQWHWSDSNLSEDDAEAIGGGIEAHYD